MGNVNIRLAPRSAISNLKTPSKARTLSVHVTLREIDRTSIQFSGFGSGAELADWLKSRLKVAPSPNTLATILDGTAVLAGIAPATWLLIGKPGALNGIVSSFRAETGEIAAITDFSDGGNTFFELEGIAATTILSKYIDIDFESGELSPGRCASTGIHDTAVLVACRRTNLFEVAVRRSLAPSVVETLVDAGAEFGLNLVRMGE